MKSSDTTEGAPQRSGKRTAHPQIFLIGVAALFLAASCKGPEPHSEVERMANAAGFRTPLWDGATLLGDTEADAYMGDRACASCHSEIAQKYAPTRHAQTLKPVTLAEHGDFFRKEARLTDPLMGFEFAPGIEGGRCVMTGSKDGKRSALPADYVIGSGRNALTFLSREAADSWVDLRISYYTGAKKWDFTPQQKPGDRVFSRAAGINQTRERLTACLQCHSTYLRADTAKPGGIDEKKSHLGIGCERCHGPGRNHVEAVDDKSGTPRFTYMERFREAAPERISELCGTCHRSPANARDGDPKIENGLARFQGVALARSACFQKSRELSCLTCHDPHGDVDMDTTRQEAACLKCHSDTVPSATHDFVRKTCRVNPRNGCIECHMPKQSISTIPYAVYHNHWIKVWKKP